jgi:hypothetical protein
LTPEVVNFPDALSVGTLAVGEVLDEGVGDPEVDGLGDTLGVAVLGAGIGATVLVGCPARVTGATIAFTQTTSATTATAPMAIPAHRRGPVRRTASLACENALDRVARTSRGLVGGVIPPP